MVLQFQTMQRRRVRHAPRRPPTATVECSDNTEIQVPEQSVAGSKGNRTSNINLSISILITLPVDASPADMMYALKQLVRSFESLQGFLMELTVT